MDIAYCPDRLSVKTEGLPEGWLLVETNPEAHTSDWHAVSRKGVAYTRRATDDYGASFWRPVDDSPLYRGYADWPKGVTFQDDAPLVCPCGSDRLHIVYSGCYETSGKCPDCGFASVVHDG